MACLRIASVRKQTLLSRCERRLTGWAAFRFVCMKINLVFLVTFVKRKKIIQPSFAGSRFCCEAIAEPHSLATVWVDLLYPVNPVDFRTVVKCQHVARP